MLNDFIKSQNKQNEELKRTIKTMGTKIDTLDLHVRKLTAMNSKLEDHVCSLSLRLQWVQKKLEKEKKVTQREQPKIEESFEDQ